MSDDLIKKEPVPVEPIPEEPPAEKDKYDQSFLLKDDITAAEADKVVLKLAGPAVAEQVLMALVGMADMIQVSRIGPAAITAVGLTNQPMMFAMAIFMAINVGTTAVVARFIGARNLKDANETARQSLVIVTLLGLVVGAVMFLVAEPVLLFMGAEPDAMFYGVKYFRIVSVSMVFNTIQMCVNSMIRGAGDTKAPMINNTAVNLINVVFNFLLINGIWFFPKMGVSGAATATAFSRLVGCIMALSLVMVPGKRITISFKGGYHFNWDLIKRVAKVGMPAAAEQFVMRIGMIFFTRTVSGLGTIVFAAHQVAINITSLSFTTGQGFGMSATSLVGRCLGAKKPDMAEKFAKAASHMSMLVSVGVAFLLFFAGDKVALLYTDDASVIASASIILKLIALVQPLQSIQFVLAGALRGAGDTKWPLYSTIVGVWFFRLGLAVILVQYMHMGLLGAWIAMMVDQAARSLVIQWRFNTNKWKHIHV